jgi:hypothetical protein
VSVSCSIAAILAAFVCSILSDRGDRGVIVFTNVHALSNFDPIKQPPFVISFAGPSTSPGLLTCSTDVFFCNQITTNLRK